MSVSEVSYVIEGHRFSYWPEKLEEAHRNLCELSDAEFLQALPEVLHLACMLCFVLDTPTHECLSDRGVIHQLAHLIHIGDEPAVELRLVREKFAGLELGMRADSVGAD